MPVEDRWGFNEWAPSYDEDVHDETHEGSWIFEHHETILDKVVEYCELSENSYSTVLDIGVGTGNLVSRFLERGLTVIGIDPSEEMRKICTVKIPEIRRVIFLIFYRKLVVLISSFLHLHSTTLLKSRKKFQSLG